ncbi:protein NLRC3-like [Pygocentrus nattereri]|uniref:protein NLRC3-like n=1 Tax=Pygocentrus nattereri TaxID=42514 RepID=UPI001891CAC0|nr:protein NLRC3-like [Pygocentrus nattereri]
MASSVPEILLETLQGLERENLKLFQWYLINGVEGFKCIPPAQLEKPELMDTVDKMVQCYECSGAVKITLAILKKINQNQLAMDLKIKIEEKEDRCEKKNDKTLAATFTTEHGEAVKASAADEQHQNQVISRLSHIYERILIGNSQTGHKEYLDDVYTDLIVVPNESGGVIHKHEMVQLELSQRPGGEETFVKCSDLFKVQPGTSRRNRKVLTMGIAGVGKTVSVSKFISDWVKKVENRDINFIFPLPFRELNLIKDNKYSLIELLNHFFFTSTLKLESLPEDEGKVLFVFDGLDECCFPLCFEHGHELKDVSEQASLGSLITNLVNGNLLPFALVWITCRPAAAQMIPRDHIDLVTEVQGFNYEQKEAYFSKYCKEDVAMKRKMISHIKKSRSLCIMCQIPVFCWITATVLQPLMAQDSINEIPATLTGMYTNFLLLQKQIMMKKYPKEHEATKKALDTDHIILKLGKLAFNTLESGRLHFYEDDLMKCGIDVAGGTVFSGVCTQIFGQEQKVSGKNIFSFVHLSVQECLAALYVHYKYCNQRRNVFEPRTICNMLKWKNKNLADLHKCAVERALKSERGHLDLFLRFLLGLSLESNQKTLQELLKKINISVHSVGDTTNYIKEKLNEQTSSDRSMNLFHCLSELKDNSLTREIQDYLTSGSLSSQELSSTQWSALVFVLLMSEETEEKFELKKCRPSDEGLKRLLPVMKNTQRALLDRCNLSKDSCTALASVLSSNSSLRELDLSYNDLQDRTVDLLSAKLSDSQCKLEVLRLAGCNLTMNSCEALASVLQSENSYLKELDLSDNDLQDSGVKLLSGGLKSSQCKLEILRLSGCLVTDESCSSLASALSSNPSYLKELDLTYNNPGYSRVNMLSARLEDPRCNLKMLRMEHAGKNRIKPGLIKYGCELKLDPNTAHSRLSLSDGNRKATCSGQVCVQQLYPDHPERFNYWEQVLCEESLTGRCYWECEWSGVRTEIAMTYKGISRKGKSFDSRFGWNENSWSLDCSEDNCCALHNKKGTKTPDASLLSKRVGVFLDWSAGTLSFYSVFFEKRKLIHTFHSKFAEPLYVGFRVGEESSVCLCQIA